MFTRINIAAAVAAIRQIDAEDKTDNAITEVADTLHLDRTEVGEIARDESHELALFEDQRRDEARGAFGFSDRMPWPGECVELPYARGTRHATTECARCGALMRMDSDCEKCGKQLAEA